MDYLVGIDLGSTNLKAVVYDPDGRAVASGSRPTVRSNPYPDHPDWAIWQPEQIWSGVAVSLQEALARVPQPHRIRGVTVTGMGMDGLPMTQDGSWLYPFISWHCPRTLPQQRWWCEHIGADRQFALTGTPIWGFNTALRLLWMREHEPRILDRTFKWVLIEDFVNFQLCGRFATDYSMASTTLLFDQRQRKWSAELARDTGIDPQLLCEVLPSGTVLGEVHGAAAAATGLPLRTPVVLGGHDYCCGMLPTGAFRPGVVLDVTGTWEMVVTALDEPILDPAVGRLGVFVDSHVARGKWTVMGGAVAADMLEWFRREFATAEKRTAAEAGGVDWDYLMAAAQSSPAGSRGVFFLPHMSGGSCPHVDPTSMGAWVGLRNFVTRSDMLRALIEGLDYQFLEILEAYETGLGVSPERIVAIGGATHNEFWMQNKADVVGKPIEVPALEEAVPLGAAILAGIGAGIYRDEAEAFARVTRPSRVYQPNAQLAPRYREWYGTYQQLYPALRSIHERLHKQD
jgi:xylulokinase